MNEPDEITGMKGNTIPRKISVDYISFSAHVDYSQNSEFIDLIKAPYIVSSSAPFPFHLFYRYLRSLCTVNKQPWVA
jgi:Cft2 family RNA processing exonuclease